MENDINIKIKQAKKDFVKKLDLSGYGIETLPEGLFELHHIEILILSFNRIKEIPGSMKQLENLKVLDLTSNLLTEIPVSLFEFRKLEILFLGSNQIRKISSDISKFQALNTLILSNNLINNISSEIKQLHILETLDLNTNLIMNIPRELYELTTLINLDISSNLLTSLSADIVFFHQLQYLDLSSNFLLELPQGIRHLSNLTSLFVFGNYLQTPPIEILRTDDFGRVDLDSVINYFIDLERSKGARISEAKLILVGNGRVGKTSTLSRLKYNSFNEKEVSTHGINIEEIELKIGDDLVLICNIWDFGGQEIFHATHRFFLTSRALYLVLWTKHKMDIKDDKYEKKFPLDYWLDTVKVLSNSSPIILVQNKIDKAFHDLDNRNILRENYNVREFVSISAATNQHIRLLKEKILEQFKNNEKLKAVYGFLLPKSWIKIKQKLHLLSKSKKYIRYQKFLDICFEEGISEVSAQTLSFWLHEAGRILHFTDSEHLWEIIVLQPRWATELIYKFLDKEIIEKKGIFKKNMLLSIWNENVDFITRKKESSIILELMQRFEICFRLAENSDLFIIPQLLKKCEVDLNSYIIGDPLIVVRKFNFLYEGVFYRYIVRLSRYLKGKLFWQDTLIIEILDTIGIIKCNLPKREITLIVSGKEKEQTFSILIGELKKLQKDIEFKDKIRTTCKKCSRSEVTCFNDLEYIKGAYEKNLQIVTCPKSHEFIYLKNLFTSKPSPPEIVRKVKDEIANGNTFKALEELLEYSKYKNRLLFNDVLILKSNYEETQKMFLLGQLTIEEKTKSLSKIKNGVLAILEEFNSDSIKL
jgi:small GTP-binding protein